jgi:gamma-glutamylcyclotransferase (GGCT)/AIG2-like uncharacterized protein YtfP
MDLFVYGTLTEPARVASVVDAYVFVGPARIDGLHPVEGRYPTLAPGGTGAGRLLRVDDAAVDAVDAYEGVAEGTYVRVAVPYAPAGADGDDDAPRTVSTYVGDPDRLGVGDAVAFPGTGSLRERVRRYGADAGVSVRPVD